MGQGHQGFAGVLGFPFPPGLVDFPFVVKRIEILGHVAGGFAGSQKQDAPGVQGKIEQLQGFFLQHALEIDEQVAAAEQIDVGEGRILDDVVPGKDHHFPDVAVDLEVVRPAVEVLGQQGGGQVAGDAFRILAGAGPLDRVPVDVGGENLDIH